MKQITTLTTPEPKEGETYKFSFIRQDGTGQHIMLLDGDKEAINWQDAMEWAKELGGDLPDRAESAMLFNQSKDQFEEAWYWTNEQHAEFSDYAWFQSFHDGNQLYWSKSHQLRARAVRRVSFLVI